MKKLWLGLIASCLVCSAAEAEPLTPASSAPPAAPAPAPAAAPAQPAAAAKDLPDPVWPVAGVYTTADTKDLGTLTGWSWLKGVKIRGWIDGYYERNLNAPSQATVNRTEAQAASIVKGQSVTIEGRTFDIHDNSFSFSLAELEVEKVPDFGGAGFKLDLAVGETQEIIANTIRGGLGVSANDPIYELDKLVQHASISYVAPLGRGLRFDFGKFVTHIGEESIETVKDWNYSRSLGFTYAIPLQDVGLHVSYAWTDTFNTDLYVLNGWNATIDNNRGLSIGPAIGWAPTSWFLLTANYLGGPEQLHNTSNLRHLFDAQAFFGPLAKLSWGFVFDYGLDTNAVPDPSGVGLKNATWLAVAGMLRYQAASFFEPTLRLEYYDDPEGFTTGLPQHLMGATLTANFKLGMGKSNGSMILVRPEIRYDQSSANFFTKGASFRSTDHQLTIGAGVSWLF